MKFYLKAKYHIHFNLHVVKRTDKDAPLYQVSTICQVKEGASSNGGRCSSVCVATSFLSDCFSRRLGRTPVLTWGVGRLFVGDSRLGMWSAHWGLGWGKSDTFTLDNPV